MTAATIKDVAAKANVSVMTVSRVLNGGRFVSEPTRERVQTAIDDLQFRRNASARGLPEQRTYVIAIVASHIASYVAEIQRGAIRQCRLCDYHLAVVSPDPDQPDLVAAMRGLVSSLRVDGLILTPPLVDRLEVLDFLDARRLPYVRISPSDALARSPSVRIDDVAAAEAMTDHLLDLGHRRIGFIVGPDEHAAAARRLEGYRRALARRGVAFDARWLAAGGFLFGGGLRATQALLAQTPRPTAIFASNDHMALGAISAAHQAGLSIPDQIAIAGFDDGEAARQVWPMLTTIRQPMAALGQTAAELLIARSGRGGAEAPFAAVQLDYGLIVRGSTVKGA